MSRSADSAAESRQEVLLGGQNRSIDRLAEMLELHARCLDKINGILEKQHDLILALHQNIEALRQSIKDDAKIALDRTLVSRRTAP